MVGEYYTYNLIGKHGIIHDVSSVLCRVGAWNTALALLFTASRLIPGAKCLYTRLLVLLMMDYMLSQNRTNLTGTHLVFVSSNFFIRSISVNGE